MGTFADEMRLFAKNVAIRNDKQCRAIALTLFTKVIMRTPVGNPSLWKDPDRAPKGYVGGRARHNWYVMVGAKPAVVKVTDAVLGKDKPAAEAHLLGQLTHFNREHPIWLTNGLPYMHRLEYDSWSKQAPNGMVRVSLTEIGAIVRES